MAVYYTIHSSFTGILTNAIENTADQQPPASTASDVS